MPIDLNEHLRQKNRNYNDSNTSNNSNNDKGGGNSGNNKNRGFQTPKMPNFSMPNGKKW